MIRLQTNSASSTVGLLYTGSMAPSMAAAKCYRWLAIPCILCFSPVTHHSHTQATTMWYYELRMMMMICERACTKRSTITTTTTLTTRHICCQQQYLWLRCATKVTTHVDRTDSVKHQWKALIIYPTRSGKAVASVPDILYLHSLLTSCGRHRP